MSSVTLDESAIGKLSIVAEPVEVRDAQGKIIGFFRPLPRVYTRKEDIPEISEEDWQRMLQGKLYTTEEILRRLEEGQ